MSFGLYLLFALALYIFVAWRYYNKGLKASGHVCKNHEVGVRYNPRNINMVTLICRKCYEPIPSELKLIEKTHEDFPYFPEISKIDYEAHMEIYHGKSTLTGK